MHILYKALYISVSLMCAQGLFGQTIKFEADKFPNAEITLAYSYADGIYTLKKQHTSEEGSVLFYNDTLATGIYFLLCPDSCHYEFLYDNQYPGKITVVLDSDKNEFNISAPLPTEHYHKFLSQTNEKQKPSGARNKVIEELLQLDNNSFLTTVLNCHKNVEVPKYKPKEGIEHSDSAAWHYRLNYYQKHYLDNIELGDPRLLNTPLYTQKINEFLDKNTKQDILSIQKSIDIISRKSSINNTTFEFSCNYLFKKLHSKKNNPVYEKVYLDFIRENYLESENIHISNTQRAAISREYNRRFPSSLGQTAPNIISADISGNNIGLHSQTNKYTILYFYDHDCPLCKKIVPSLQQAISVYNYLDVNVFAVCLGENTKEWQRYVERHKMGKWHNACNPQNNAKVSVDYDLSYTPTLFLLDRDKKIIGKNLTAKQLNATLLEVAIAKHK